MAETQGGKANKSGKILEQQVTNALSLHGFQTIEYKTWVALSMFDRRGRKLICNAPYTSIYAAVGKSAGRDTRASRSEFIVSDDATDTFCRVECKWQAVSGSVDEKLPYVYLNAIESWDEDECETLKFEQQTLPICFMPHIDNNHAPFCFMHGVSHMICITRGV